MLPSLAKARQTTKRIACSGNLHEFGKAVVMYANDQNGNTPASTAAYYFWDYLLAPYLNYDYSKLATNQFSVFHCPGARANTSYSAYRSRGYSINDYLTRPDTYGSKSTANIASCKSPADTVCLTDAAYSANSPDSYEAYTRMSSIGNCSVVNPGFDAYLMDYRHQNCLNVLFIDTHVTLCRRGSLNGYGYVLPVGTRWYNNGTLY